MSVKQRKTMNSSYFSTPPVVKNLIIINCLAFLGVWLIPSLNQFMGQYGVLYWFGSPYYHSYQFRHLHVSSCQPGTSVFQYVRTVDVRPYAGIRARLEALSDLLHGLRRGGRAGADGSGGADGRVRHSVAGSIGCRNGIAVGFRCAVAQFDHHAAYPAHSAKSQVVRYYLCGDRTVVGMDRTRSRSCAFRPYRRYAVGLGLLYYWRRKGIIRF